MFSNYSVKKILPRLVIIAIAVNLSYYICAALVDISNILGANLYAFIDGVEVGKGLRGNEVFTGVAGGVSIITGIALGAAALILILVNLGTVAMAVLLVFLCLAMREVLVTVLIIISPIAFVLYLLPNTEKWFKKWLNEFMRCLFIYPLVAIVWGATELVSDIIIATDDDIGLFKFVIICMLQIVPVLTLLPILKMGGQAMGKLQGVARSGLEKTPIKPLGNALGTIARTAPPRLIGAALQKKGGGTELRNLRARQKAAEATENDTNASDEERARAHNEAVGLKFKADSLEASRTKGQKFADAMGLGIGYTARFETTKLTESMRDREIGKTDNARRLMQTEANTDAAKAKVKLDVDNSVRSLKNKLENEKYRIKLEARDQNIQHEGKMQVAKIESEEGVNSAKFRAADVALAMAPNSPGVAAYRDSLQAKLTDNNVALLENSGIVNGKAGAGAAGIVAALNGPKSDSFNLKYTGEDGKQREVTKQSIIDGSADSEQARRSIMQMYQQQLSQVTSSDEMKNYAEGFEELFGTGNGADFAGGGAKVESMRAAMESQMSILNARDVQRGITPRTP
jgi:soluble cytochrome b562